MKKVLFVLLFLSNQFIFSQEVKIFMVELASESIIADFKLENGYFQYIGKDKAKIEFFKNFQILDFFQSFPDSQRERTLNIFTIVSYQEDLASKLVEKFSSEYLGFMDISDFKVELTSTYPNDYGTTSPVANYGVTKNIESHDYVNVPKAWDFTYGNSNIVIGISDGKILETEIDFVDKITFLPSYTYHSLPFSFGVDVYTHGTSVTAIAAAQGNNSHGMAGVCSNCSIVATNYGFNNPGTYTNPNPNFNNLLQLALNGARVINMSWSGYSTSPNYDYYQWVIDEIYDMGVVMVAAAGNKHYYDSVNNHLYPASFNHVISVSSVNHLRELCEGGCGPDGSISSSSPFYNASLSYYVKDMISPRVAPDFNGSGLIVSVTDDPNKLHTTNNRVDICAPGIQVFQYASYLLGGYINWTGQPTFYGNGTSSAAPYVSGTIGLMLSLNDCLNPDEVEDIIQLTAKNLESVQGNEYFHGMIGAGKLETGDAVEFVSEAMSHNGNALIEGNDFWRFDFNLTKIKNDLTIQNQTLRDNNISNFVTGHSISILPNTHLKPNTEGYVSLKVLDNIELCGINNRTFTNNKNSKAKDIDKLNDFNQIFIYPNPNDGVFNLNVGEYFNEKINVIISDINGRTIYNDQLNQENQQESVFRFNIKDYSSGIYFVKIISKSQNKTFKIVKK